VIECSPLLRTLETAVGIAKELGVTQININYQIFEWLKDEFFPDGCPVDDMLFTKTGGVDEERTYIEERLGPNAVGIEFTHDRSYQ